MNMTSTSITGAMMVHGDSNQIDSCMNYDDSSWLMNISTCPGADLAQVPQRCYAAAAAAVCLMVQRWKPPVAEKCCHTLWNPPVKLLLQPSRKSAAACKLGQGFGWTLKDLHNVERRFHCLQTFLGLDFWVYISRVRTTFLKWNRLFGIQRSVL